MTFRILVVCTGNICRSPLAQLVIAHQLSDVQDVEVVSAGTRAMVGSGVPEATARLAAEHDLRTEDHRAVQVDPSMIESAGLILALAREHRTQIVQMVPSAVRRTFTLREFARIVPEAITELSTTLTASDIADTGSALRAAVSAVSSLRGIVEPPESPADFDVEDPYGRPDEIYQRSFEVLAPAAEAIGSYLSRAGRFNK